MTKPAQLALRSLVKLRGRSVVLRRISGIFLAGEISTIEGTNGSGKSTLLAILAGILKATRGSIEYQDAYGQRYKAIPRRHLGYVGHHSLLYPDLTAFENLRLFASVYGLKDAPSRVARVADRFELGTFANRPIRTYSRGQQQRIALARALLCAPQVLLCDEPDTGLDSASTDRLVRTLEEEKARGVITILVTHDQGLAERLGTRRMVLRAHQLLHKDGGEQTS